jgi:putative hemolysin
MKKVRRDSKMVVRIEGPTVVGFAAAMTALWVLGEQGSQTSRYASDSMRSPIVGGTPIILLIVCVIVLNAWFVAAETALNLLKPMHLKSIKDEDAAKGKYLQNLIDSKQKYVAASTLGSQTSRLALALISFLLAQPLALFLEQSVHWTFSFPTVLLSATIIAVPVALVNVIVGEVVPKSFATLHPMTVALASYRFIRVTSIIFSIPANAVVALASVFTARFGGRASLANTNQAEEEIKNLVESAEETGEIEKDEKDLLHSVFSFTDKVAREVMTPRVDMDALPIASAPADIVQLINESGHSRIPLYEETDDQIVGIVHAKDLLMALVDGHEKVDVRKLMRPALFVPENKDLHDLLKEMRNGRVQMAVVQDEFGGTAGIVTVEDIVEELVGDITDEYDFEAPEIVQTTDGYLVLGKTHLDAVNQQSGSVFDSDEFDTIGGYVFGLMGRQPKLNESIVSDGYRFTVVESDGRRILRVKLEKCDDDPEAGEDQA